MLGTKHRLLKQLAIAGFVLVFFSLSFVVYHKRDAITLVISKIGSAKWKSGGSQHAFPRPPRPKIGDYHPISTLINRAYDTFSTRLGQRSWSVDWSVEQAAARYRERRGGHPPPGFDKWFEATQHHDAIIVEEFFDRIHHDINRFWGVDPLEMRRNARKIEPQKRTTSHIIHVRDGRIVHFDGDNNGGERSDRVALWEAMIKDMLPHLPNFDMLVNLIDEPRMLVPWEDLERYIVAELSSRQTLHPVAHIITQQTSFVEIDADPDAFDPEWHDDVHKNWDSLRKACPPNSPAHGEPSLEMTTDSINILFPTEPLPYTEGGFIANFTEAQNPCVQPHLRGMHGTFVEPFTMRTATKLFPIFSGSKLPANNDLLIPSAMYLSDQVRYSGGRDHGGPWATKTNGLIWRGTASGGRNQRDNWWHLQRHRFMQMMNGTAVALVEGGDPAAAPTFDLQAIYNSTKNHITSSLRDGRLGPWLSEWSDVGFNRLDCSPERKDWLGRLRIDCLYTDPFFALVDSVPMAEQYNRKFLPDVDGNSYSARFRGFLLSTSYPLKATIYTEWHDDRLVPWLHFVPFDNTFAETYAIMEYFLDGHDAEAHRIAEMGCEWAAKVLRKEDMMLYTWRLLPEYARVLDPERERLGFVDDIM
ncbi:lipopolysaccharide-modifying protein [Xylariaceae sp. FL0255]|nr:lipopolysaccharide-modifying protein [Xylariaceae sp. FL0255]